MSTMQTTNVTCPHCGRTNRVPVAAEGHPKCGKCKHPLLRMVDAGDDDFTEVAERADVLCLTCGQVGCCDSSPNRHARRHAAADGHPIVKSFQPGEAWRWCYVHEAFV